MALYSIMDTKFKGWSRLTVDEKAAASSKVFFEKYILQDYPLQSAGEQAGIDKTHSVMGRILKNVQLPWK